MRQLMIVFGMLCFYTTQAQSSFWDGTTEPTTVTRTIRFSYGGYNFTDKLSFRRADYEYYKALSKTQPNSAYATEHSSHPYLLQLAKVLDEDAKELGYTGYTLAEYLVAFVQQAIPYTKDPYNYGYDYPKYPIETLVDATGDCEDKAALLVALLNTFGFDAILVNTPGHMAAAIACDGCSGYYNHNGKRYSFIETTGSGWRIGTIPPSSYTAATLLDVPRPPQYTRGQTTTPKPWGEGEGSDFWTSRGGKKQEGDSWDAILQKARQGGNRWRSNDGSSTTTATTSTTTTTVTVNGVTYRINGSGSVTVNNGQVTITTQ